jgi:hypothetical protein
VSSVLARINSKEPDDKVLTLDLGAFFSLMPTTVASLTEPAIMTAGFGLLVTGTSPRQ